MKPCHICNARICMVCEMALRKELAEWRSGKRRVHWRGKYHSRIDGEFVCDFFTRAEAVKHHNSCFEYYDGYQRVKVTVRPKGAKR